MSQHKKAALNKKYYLYTFFIFLFSISINQFYGNIGISPFDSNTFNAGYNVLKGNLPFKDYWVSAGVLLDLIQSIFFRFAGINWFSYVLHASLFNFVISIFTFITLIQFNLKQSYSFFYAILVSLVFYPIPGIPYPDFHALIFSLLGVFSFVLALKYKKNIYWFLLPILLILGFFSKQTPTAYIGFIILLLTIYYFIINFKKESLSFFLSALFGTATILLLTTFFFVINEIDFRDFYNQYILFASTIGKNRLIVEGFIFPIEFNRYILRFKLIHLSYFILLIILVKNLINNYNFIKNEDFIILLTIIFLGFILVIQQLFSSNTIFIFCTIPILVGFSHVFYLKYLKYKKSFEIMLLFLAFVFTIYYFVIYVNERKFVVRNTHYSYEKSIKASKLSNKLNNLKWITNYYQDPNEEIKDLQKVITFIKNDDEKRRIIITDYQFIFGIFSITNYPLNKWYHPGVSYPLPEEDYANLYKEYFLKNLNKNNIKKIYVINPLSIDPGDKIFDNLLKKECMKLKIIDKNLTVYNIENCY